MLVTLPGRGQSRATQEYEPATHFLSWPRIAAGGKHRLLPMTEKRVGFTLGPEARGQRVVVAISAFMESGEPSGYNGNTLAVDVNGEVMGLRIGDHARLLNRPMEFPFGTKTRRLQISGREGKLGLIENWGSARWALPWTSSLEAWLASADYQPVGLRDPTWIILEITDLVHPDAFNYLRIKNEGSRGILRCENVSVHCEPSASAAIEAAAQKLWQKHFGRDAIIREPVKGREWAYDMNLIDNAHGAAGGMAEIQTIEDARRIIAPLRKQGYDALMVSGLHMRYTYTDLWETRIVPYMTHISRAAHEAGMKVIDHYDVPIFYARGYPFLLAEDHLDWTQRDIRYGTATRMYCINNPAFRTHFFDFTRRVQRATGIDAYQIDEVYFFDKNFCGCEHCRRRFKAETGFELPREADSPVFFNNADALWQLFMLWRGTCVQSFKKDFLASIRQENPAAFLSTYTTTYLQSSRRGNAWGNFLVSYANGKEGVSRLPFHDYRYCLADFRLTTGVADALGHATWMLWYPLTGSAARFCWGMSQASGCAQWHSKQWSSSVRDLIKWPHTMKKLDFEMFADVAVVFSDTSKNASSWTGYYHGMEALGWGEAMVEHNIQYQVLHESAVTAESLSRFSVVILPAMTVIDSRNRDAFEAYVRAGGTLVVTANTGMLGETKRPRPDFLLGEMMNLRFVDVLNAPFEVVEGGFAYTRDRMFYKYGARMLHVATRDADPARSRVPVHFRKDGKTYPGIVASTYGRGEVFTIATFLGVSNYQMGLHEGRKNIFKTNPDSASFMADTLRTILGKNERVVPVDLPRKMVCTSWIRKRKRDEINVHFLNVHDHKPLGPDEAGKRRQIRFPLVDREMTLLLRRIAVDRAVFHSPDTAEPVPCRIDRTPDGTRVTIPAGKMKMYGLLKAYRTK